ncbi:MAG: hypothetical protein V1740_04835 [Candidatus Woesearchaeota archaeon]
MSEGPQSFLGYHFEKAAGEGTWKGALFFVDDDTGAKLAVKKYRETEANQRTRTRRGIDSRKSAINETCGGNTTQFPHLMVPIKITNPDGSYVFIEEPADSTLGEHFERRISGVGREELINLSMSIGEALYEMHVRLNRAHQDIKPDNIFLIDPDRKGDTSTLDDLLIKLGDHGHTSQGSMRNMDFGYTSYKSPEMFTGVLKEIPECEGERLALKKSCDMYSVGALLFEAITGENLFKSKIHEIWIDATCHKTAYDDPERDENIAQYIDQEFGKYIRAKYEDPESWNNEIDRKIDSEDIPKAYKRLLKRLVCHRDSRELRKPLNHFERIIPDPVLDRFGYRGRQRIADGRELKQELIQIVKEYKRTYPENKARRNKRLIGAAAFGAIALAALAGFQYVQWKNIDSLESAVVQSDRKADFERKYRIAELHLNGRLDPLGWAEMGEYAGWKNNFDDQWTGIAAFFDINSVLKAAAQAGYDLDPENLRKVEYERIKGNLRNIDLDLTTRIIYLQESGHSSKGGGPASYTYDGVVAQIGGEFDDAIQRARQQRVYDLDRAQRLVRDYTQSQAELDTEELRKAQNITGMTNSGIENKIYAQERRLQALSEITGLEGDALADYIHETDPEHEKRIRYHVSEYIDSMNNYKFFTSPEAREFRRSEQYENVSQANLASVEHHMRVLQRLTGLDANTLRTKIKEGWGIYDDSNMGL